jgi:hypothetical protein
VAQAVEHLSSKHKILSSNLNTGKEKNLVTDSEILNGRLFLKDAETNFGLVFTKVSKELA